MGKKENLFSNTERLNKIDNMSYCPSGLKINEFTNAVLRYAQNCKMDDYLSSEKYPTEEPLVSEELLRVLESDHIWSRPCSRSYNDGETREKENFNMREMMCLMEELHRSDVHVSSHVKLSVEENRSQIVSTKRYKSKKKKNPDKLKKQHIMSSELTKVIRDQSFKFLGGETANTLKYELVLKCGSDKMKPKEESLVNELASEKSSGKLVLSKHTRVKEMPVKITRESNIAKPTKEKIKTITKREGKPQVAKSDLKTVAMETNDENVDSHQDKVKITTTREMVSAGTSANFISEPKLNTCDRCEQTTMEGTTASNLTKDDSFKLASTSFPKNEAKQVTNKKLRQGDKQRSKITSNESNVSDQEENIILNQADVPDKQAIHNSSKETEPNTEVIQKQTGAINNPSIEMKRTPNVILKQTDTREIATETNQNDWSDPNLEHVRKSEQRTQDMETKNTKWSNTDQVSPTTAKDNDSKSIMNTMEVKKLDKNNNVSRMEEGQNYLGEERKNRELLTITKFLNVIEEKCKRFSEQKKNACVETNENLTALSSVDTNHVVLSNTYNVPCFYQNYTKCWSIKMSDINTVFLPTNTEKLNCSEVKVDKRTFPSSNEITIKKKEKVRPAEVSGSQTNLVKKKSLTCKPRSIESESKLKIVKKKIRRKSKKISKLHIEQNQKLFEKLVEQLDIRIVEITSVPCTKIKGNKTELPMARCPAIQKKLRKTNRRKKVVEVVSIEIRPAEAKTEIRLSDNIIFKKLVKFQHSSCSGFRAFSCPLPCTRKGVPDQTIEGHKSDFPIATICLTTCRYDIVRTVAEQFNMTEKLEDEDWDLLWTDFWISVDRCKSLKKFQRVNHFPGMNELCRKDLLTRNLVSMNEKFPVDYDFYPKSWLLPQQLKEVTEFAKTRSHVTFILKPERGCQGKGIYLVKNIRDIRPFGRVICQIYIERPLLIDGFKFDFRVYVLITCCDPLRVFVYNDGLVRFATVKYRLPTQDNISNLFMHLTNAALNKTSTNYVLNGNHASKRKISALNYWFKENGLDVVEIWKDIDEIIIKTIIAGLPKLRATYHECFDDRDEYLPCFELLGFDILLDEYLKPYVLEVNHTPSFQTDTDLDKDVKGNLLYDTFVILNLFHSDKRKHLIRKGSSGSWASAYSDSDGGSTSSSEDSFLDNRQTEWEEQHRGNFRQIFPPCSKPKYRVFFEESQLLWLDRKSKEEAMPEPQPVNHGYWFGWNSKPIPKSTLAEKFRIFDKPVEPKPNVQYPRLPTRRKIIKRDKPHHTHLPHDVPSTVSTPTSRKSSYEIRNSIKDLLGLCDTHLHTPPQKISRRKKNYKKGSLTNNSNMDFKLNPSSSKSESIPSKLNIVSSKIGQTSSKLENQRQAVVKFGTHPILKHTASKFGSLLNPSTSRQKVPPVKPSGIRGMFFDKRTKEKLFISSYDNDTVRKWPSLPRKDIRRPSTSGITSRFKSTFLSTPNSPTKPKTSEERRKPR